VVSVELSDDVDVAPSVLVPVSVDGSDVVVEEAREDVSSCYRIGEEGT
jgi:hypothetical protein